ncbi:MAG: holo-ACP synthase [candidate division Zixibacteria bacterium]|nr:holo-ACP synthase [candidate division Zixibacteria bacterium]
MVTSVGIDIIEVARIKKDVERYGRRFVGRILGPHELPVFDRRYDKAVFLAGRFAAKEAVVKALGGYLTEKPPLTAIQVINDPTGRPELKLPVDIESKLGGVRCLISITHEKDYAVAIAVIEEEK